MTLSGIYREVGPVVPVAGVCWFKVIHSLLLERSLASTLMSALDKFREDEEVMADMAKVKRKVTEEAGKNAQLMETVKSIWGILYADDACIYCVSITWDPRNEYGDHRPCGRAVWTVGVRTRNGNHVLLAIGMKACSFMINATGMMFRQEKDVLYLGGMVYEDGSIEDEINHRVQAAHDCFRRNSQAIHGL
ncbi:unnamed protein product [Pylaiella littoralis]